MLFMAVSAGLPLGQALSELELLGSMSCAGMGGFAV
jgi:hypothetical protein